MIQSAPCASTALTPPAATTPAGRSPTLLTFAAGTALRGFSGIHNIGRDTDGIIKGGFTYSPSADASVTAKGGGSFSYVFSSQLSGGTMPPAGTFTLTRTASPDFGRSLLTASVEGRTFTVSQLDVGLNNPLIGLQYTGFALIKLVYPQPSGGTSYSFQPQVFGLAFDPAAKALTGTAVYAGQIAGFASAGQLEGFGSVPASQNVYDVTGTITIRIDYATGTLSGDAHIFGKNQFTGEAVDFGTVPVSSSGNAAIPLDRLGGSIGNGTFQLQLNGPSGEELGGIFDSVVADPRGPVSVHVFAVVVAAR